MNYLPCIELQLHKRLIAKRMYFIDHAPDAPWDVSADSWYIQKNEPLDE